MINKFFGFLVFGVLLFDSVGAISAQTNAAAKGRTSSLTASLPPSDIAVRFDAKKFFDTALPQVLANNQPRLAEITGKIDELKDEIGIDARQFEQIAVGISVKKLSAKDYDVAPLVLMRGAEVKAGGLTSMLKLAGKEIKQTQIAGKTVYTIQINNPPSGRKMSSAKPGMNGDVLDRAIDRMFDDVSVTAFDDNTLAVGTPERVRQLLTTKLRIAPDVSEPLGRNSSSVISFAAKVPAGMSALFGFENDEIGKNIDSIKYLSGSADAGDGAATIQLTAKTLTAPQAQSLLELVQGFQMIGKTFLGSSKSEEKQVYTRLLENAVINRNLTEVTLDLQIAQSDIDILVKQKEKKPTDDGAVDKSSTK